MTFLAATMNAVRKGTPKMAPPIPHIHPQNIMETKTSRGFNVRRRPRIEGVTNWPSMRVKARKITGGHIIWDHASKVSSETPLMMIKVKAAPIYGTKFSMPATTPHRMGFGRFKSAIAIAVKIPKHKLITATVKR